MAVTKLCFYFCGGIRFALGVSSATVRPGYTDDLQFSLAKMRQFLLLGANPDLRLLVKTNFPTPRSAVARPEISRGDPPPREIKGTDSVTQAKLRPSQHTPASSRSTKPGRSLRARRYARRSCMGEGHGNLGRVVFLPPSDQTPPECDRHHPGRGEFASSAACAHFRFYCYSSRPGLAMQHDPRNKIRNLACLTRCGLARFSKAKSDVGARAGDAGSSSQGKIERFRSATGLNKHCCSPASASSLFFSHAIANGRDFRRRRVARLGVAGAVIMTTTAPQNSTK